MKTQFSYLRLVLIACVLIFVLDSCHSSYHASKRRRSKGACDCPQFGYNMQQRQQPDDAYPAYL
ncbi:MAG: hypothetical protein LBV26_00200 [Bacteroidales bacterium]|nr:hypothetical protein [Bacteroidales bacterium]